ncbi:MAG: glycosyltransferase, partial [Anaerolineae bacterium]|nr:glycosyltransferase [Anaerolineae bacterium]
MHIVHVLPWLVRGGTEGQVAHLSMMLRQNGHDVTIIAGEDGPWRATLLDHQIPVIVAPPYVYKGIHSRTGRISNLYATGWLAQQFRHRKPDVVSAFLYPIAPLAMIAAHWARVPVRLRNVRDLGGLRDPGPLPRWMEQVSYRCTTRFVANSQAVADYVQHAENIPRETIEVVYNGVDVPAFPATDISESDFRREGFANPPWTTLQSRPYKDQPNEFANANERDRASIMIGMLANFWPNSKDHLMLVRAARQVIDAAPHARFVLGGRSTPYRDQVQQAIQVWQLADYVQIETVTDPAAFLAALDIGVLCSRTEGFSNAVLEYMAYGKPVVGTRIPAIAEAIREGETGYLVELGDDRALAEVLLTLIR